MNKEGNREREKALTGAFCQALIVKKGVSPDRFFVPEVQCDPIQCPSGCHACCREGVTLDLTSVESLVIYLLNKDVVDLIEQYTELHDHTGYCPFMIMDKCIINAYKPSACQMFMPFEYKGEPMCYYLAGNTSMPPGDIWHETFMNSYSYDIHGLMILIQEDIDEFVSNSFFKNIYEGTLWWKNHYHLLPDVTKLCLESILSDEYIGLQLTDNFSFQEALLAGHTAYTRKLEAHLAQR